MRSEQQLDEDAIVHDEVEVSKHLIVDAFGVDKLGVEWEVHTGFNDPYYVEEDVALVVESTHQIRNRY